MSEAAPVAHRQRAEERRLWLRLRHTKGMTRGRFAKLLDRFETPERIVGGSARELTAVPGVNDELARAILEGDLTVDLDRELDLVERYAVGIVTRDDAEYPVNLREMAAAPPLLYCVGEPVEVDRFAVTIVGTRNATGYGRSVCEEVAGALSDAGLTVVSGLALGIDATAHATALRRGGRTLAVLGNGLSRIYPAEHDRLAWEVSRNGAILSEYAMETEPDRYNFPERNEILAGLSLGVVVVEAPTKSGALLTARAALEMGRSVYAVPADVTRANSAGCNELIRDGATLIHRGMDVIEDLHAELRDLLDARKARATGDGDGASKAIKAAPPDLSFEEAQILELTREDARHFDALFETARAKGVEVDSSRLSTILLQLEMKGLVRQAPGMIFVAETRTPYEDGDQADEDTKGGMIEEDFIPY